MKRFPIEFVERTRILLQEYDGPYAVSNLLNCTLGLLILPYEVVKTSPGSLWKTEISALPDLPAFQLSFFEPIQSIDKTGVKRFYPKTLKVLLQKIRNGLAHQDIEPINERGEFVGVIIRNYFWPPDTHQDLEVQFSEQELSDFATFIADEYLKER